MPLAVVLLIGLLCVGSSPAFCMVAPERDARSDISEDGFDLLMADPHVQGGGDLDAIRQRGILRVLVTYRKGDFFIADGAIRGVEADLINGFVNWLSKKGGRKSLPVRAQFIPVPFDRLLDALREGQGDVAAAGLTVTPERLTVVPFSAPYMDGVEEIVAVHTGARLPARLDDLGGRTVHVVKGSSHAEHLRRLNEDFARRGLPLITIASLAADLQPEDLFALLDAGAIELLITDRHRGALWAKGRAGIKLLPELRLNTGGKLAWALRPGTPALKEAVDTYFAQGKGKVLRQAQQSLVMYYGDTSWHNGTINRRFIGRVKALYPHFAQHAESYGFDVLLLIAQGYRESQLNQNLRSPAGAVGVMQVLPPTARAMGFSGIERSAGTNIHAGIHYLNYIRDNYFADADVREPDRTLFALAGYNMGPNRLARIRERAARMGLDANKWFGNVEFAALRYVGREPVSYVANISSYYLAYQGVHHSHAQRQAVLQRLLQ